MEVKPTLFIANPLWDKSFNVSPQFIQNNGLNLALCDLNYQKFQEIWNQAKQVSALEGKSKFKGTCGGSGTTVMRAFASLGHDCTILGRIGNDDHGNKIIKFLSELKINSFLIKSVTEATTGVVLCLITPPDGERTMLAHLGAANDFSESDIQQEKLKHFSHWHIEGYAFYFKIASKCIEIASQSKATISVNLPTVNFVKSQLNDFKQAIPHLQYIFGNAEEITVLAGFEEREFPEKIQDIFSTFPLHVTVAATNGEKGCWIKLQGENKVRHFDVPKIEKSEMINKTGAGDVWSGIFLALSLQNNDVETCVQKANLAAAQWIKNIKNF